MKIKIEKNIFFGGPDKGLTLLLRIFIRDGKSWVFFPIFLFFAIFYQTGVFYSFIFVVLWFFGVSFL